MTEESVTNFVAVHKGSYYDSDFDSEGELEREQRSKSLKRKHEEDNDELSVSWSSSSKKKKKKHKKDRRGGPAKRSEVEKEYCKEASRTQRFHIVSMDAYSRHKKFINDYMMYYRGSRSDYKRDTSKYKTDLDIIRENHKFLWNEDEEEEESWEKRLAKKYYDKLFKEYCITDLSRYKENKVAFRWQMEKEVVSGKGQFICANKICEVKEGLRSWEVNFGYLEDGQKKNALVKVRLCPDCSYKLNYHHKRKEVTKKRKSNKKRNINEGSIDPFVKDKATLDDKEEEKEGEDDTVPSSETDKESVWTKKPEDLIEKSRDDEFEEYFEDMFLWK